VLLSNSRAASIEILESEFPTRVRRFEMMTDSGGPGEFRGGLAYRREVEVLAREAVLSFRGSGHVIAARGRDGGSNGRPASVTLNPGTPDEKALPSRFSGVVLRPGDRLRVERGGGGGLGDPRKRLPEAVIEDVRQGYVSPASAVGDYGLDPQRLP